jgi:hypothetical protein
LTEKDFFFKIDRESRSIAVNQNRFWKLYFPREREDRENFVNFNSFLDLNACNSWNPFLWISINSWLFLYQPIVLMAFILGASPIFFDWVQAQAAGYEVPTVDGRLDKGMASVQ